jgi:hypothetical protein
MFFKGMTDGTVSTLAETSTDLETAFADSPFLIIHL